MRFIFFEDRPTGVTMVTEPFDASDMHVLARQQNPEWVARYMPHAELANGLMRGDMKVRRATAMVEGAMREYIKAFPDADADEVDASDAVDEAVTEASYALGQAMHDIIGAGLQASPLLLMKMINDPSITLAQYDRVVSDDKLADELKKSRGKNRSSSVGDETHVPVNLPYGSRAEIERQKALQDMTLEERTRRMQASSGTDAERERGRNPPPGPGLIKQPRFPVADASDAVTVRHFGQGGVRYFGRHPGDGSGGASAIGQGKPSDLQFAKSAYRDAPQEIDGAMLIKQTPTLKFYRQGQNITIAVRGTRDWMDWLSNISLASQNRFLFQLSPRVRKDVADIKDFQRHFPPSDFHYRGVGHSLGGAVVDELINQNLISEGRSFNPAIHRNDLGVAQDKNERTYNPGDPLYMMKALAEGVSSAATGQPLIQPLPKHIPPPSILLENHKLESFNGSGKDDNKSSDPEDYAYSDADIRESVGSVPIHRYPDLKAMSSPSALFKGNKAAVLLFLTEGKSSGHWLVVLDHDDHYEVFDSFGVAIDGNRKWLDKEQLQEFGQTLPLLSILLEKGNKPINHNSTKLQLDSNDTCGRWVVWRIKNAHMPLKAFVGEMTSGPGTPDQKVVQCTFDILGK